MIPLPPPNTRPHPYRRLSVRDRAALDAASMSSYLDGREVYRRTDCLVLRGRRGGEAALVAVRKPSLEPLFSPVVEAQVLAGPDETAWVTWPETDVGNATALAAAAEPGRPGQRGHRTVRARQLHLGAGAGPGAGNRGGTARAAEAARPGPAGGGLRRGPAAGAAGARRGAGRGPRRRAPGAVVPAAVPWIGDRAGCPGGVPGHPTGAPAAGLAADRLRAVVAVPPSLLRRRARPGRSVPAGPVVHRGRGLRLPSPSAACSNAGWRSTATRPWCRGGPTSTRSARVCGSCCCDGAPVHLDR